MGRPSGRAMAVSNLTACTYPQLTSEGSPHASQVTRSSENRMSSGSNGHNVVENGINYVNPSSPSLGVVANCYVFKSRLQEYAQKVGIPTPVYETLMEGPSHVPVFRSSVIVNNIKYDSLPGFFNRKAAEQSAAEVALVELTKSGQMTESIPTVHETGLCKNLLQEYAQKMNYAIPLYSCTRQASGTNSFICTVEIHGIQYIGAAAKTKKEAEIKAARTALLAIQSASLAGAHGASPYTVLPGKKKGKETEQPQPESAKPLKPKKTKFKKKWPKRRVPRRKKDHQNLAKSVTDETGEVNAEVVALALTSEDLTVKYLEMLDKEIKLQLQLQAQPGLY
ncbi:double-stranded RNA-binding protein 8-like isoform X1 [Dendrobium catenatum]|uniref:Double-stranded RNA-binding protein 8 n=2 Tax=Dendrobium catenatum TaxID=906689 RepID=A0A2I0WYU3_9ASPA|nr:double-stranded RNA-binding protein 8-like isoform X1 [Dendrobium catenatum]XP_020696311.1 double-stranded RNA-binding protein 8-like isoform X1 [Dendrobium catenatum]PKU80825.1 Double-stranded RNA-binding protein 8 [Dendrobium catenatum]